MSDNLCGAPTKATGNPCKLPADTCPHHNRGGRPTKYSEEYDEQVYKLCLLGATDEQIADFFGVTVQTIHNWTERHDGFLEARKKGKEDADTRVAESLFHRALGYQHEAVKITSDGDYYPYVKQYAPDTTAAIFWLKNRQPRVWRDRKELEHSGEIEGGEQQIHVYLPDNNRKDLPDAVRERLATTNGSGG